LKERTPPPEFRAFGRLAHFAVVGAILLLASGLASCASAVPAVADYTIHISGDAGVRFSGSYLVLDGRCGSESHTAEGALPAEYHAHAAVLSVVFQKREQVGRLRVDIIASGQVVRSSETSADYGLVQIATRPDASPPANVSERPAAIA